MYSVCVGLKQMHKSKIDTKSFVLNNKLAAKSKHVSLFYVNYLFDKSVLTVLQGQRCNAAVI